MATSTEFSIFSFVALPNFNIAVVQRDAVREDMSDQSYVERVEALKNLWGHLSTFTAYDEVVESHEELFWISARVILEDGWCNISNALRGLLKRTLELSLHRFSRYPCVTSVCCDLLRLISSDPWGNPTIHAIFAKKELSLEELGEFFDVEGVRTLKARLCFLQLYSCHEYALQLVKTIIRFSSSTMTRFSEKDEAFFRHILLSTLFQLRRVQEFDNQVKSLRVTDALHQAKLFHSKQKPQAALEILRHVMRTSLHRPELYFPAFSEAFLLSVKIFKDSGVTWEKVKGLTESLQELAPHVYLYSIAGALKDVYQGEAIETWLRLYVIALAADLQVMDHMRLHCKEDEIEKFEKTISERLMVFAEAVSDDKPLCREILLSGFSLHPNEEALQWMQRIADPMDMVPSLCCLSYRVCRTLKDFPEKDIFPDGLSQAVSNYLGPENDVRSWAFQHMVPGVDRSLMLAAESYASKKMISDDLWKDMALVILHPRWKVLNWDLGWYRLRQLCRAYMLDRQISQPKVNLDFVHPGHAHLASSSDSESDSCGKVENGFKSEAAVPIKEMKWKLRPNRPIGSLAESDSDDDSLLCSSRKALKGKKGMLKKGHLQISENDSGDEHKIGAQSKRKFPNFRARLMYALSKGFLNPISQQEVTVATALAASGEMLHNTSNESQDPSSVHPNSGPVDSDSQVSSTTEETSQNHGNSIELIHESRDDIGESASEGLALKLTGVAPDYNDTGKSASTASGAKLRILLEQGTGNGPSSDPCLPKREKAEFEGKAGNQYYLDCASSALSLSPSSSDVKKDSNESVMSSVRCNERVTVSKRDEIPSVKPDGFFQGNADTNIFLDKDKKTEPCTEQAVKVPTFDVTQSSVVMSVGQKPSASSFPDANMAHPSQQLPTEQTLADQIREFEVVFNTVCSSKEAEDQQRKNNGASLLMSDVQSLAVAETKQASVPLKKPPVGIIRKAPPNATALPIHLPEDFDFRNLPDTCIVTLNVTNTGSNGEVTQSIKIQGGHLKELIKKNNPGVTNDTHKGPLTIISVLPVSTGTSRTAVHSGTLRSGAAQTVPAGSTATTPPSPSSGTMKKMTKSVGKTPVVPSTQTRITTTSTTPTTTPSKPGASKPSLTPSKDDPDVISKVNQILEHYKAQLRISPEQQFKPAPRRNSLPKDQSQPSPGKTKKKASVIGKVGGTGMPSMFHPLSPAGLSGGSEQERASSATSDSSISTDGVLPTSPPEPGQLLMESQEMKPVMPVTSTSVSMGTRGAVRPVSVPISGHGMGTGPKVVTASGTQIHMLPIAAGTSAGVLTTGGGMKVVSTGNRSALPGTRQPVPIVYPRKKSPTAQLTHEEVGKGIIIPFSVRYVPQSLILQGSLPVNASACTTVRVIRTNAVVPKDTEKAITTPSTLPSFEASFQRKEVPTGNVISSPVKNDLPPVLPVSKMVLLSEAASEPKQEPMQSVPSPSFVMTEAPSVATTSPQEILSPVVMPPNETVGTETEPSGSPIGQSVDGVPIEQQNGSSSWKKEEIVRRESLKRSRRSQAGEWQKKPCLCCPSSPSAKKYKTEESHCDTKKKTR
ncbi:unnamed protein product [Darwinula stevensoni]|uniref:Uncharacterized protein n=1 Tax=Darwinula stevensoni TaxID=69355 RepID=A0A7R9A2G5_9CRUS|nr:unnamed protein product [Darwinula stevensoni]CAG0885607.1 unnamed protein product [Darwinula stevensoni]